MQNLQDLITETSVDTLRDHLIFSVARGLAMHQTDNIYDIHFDFYGKLLAGQKEIKPRWKRALNMIDTYIGDELGTLYHVKYFQDRTSCVNMVNDITDALRQTLMTSSWMSPDTKSQALLKLSTFGLKVGYPDKIHSIEGLWPKGIQDEDLTALVLEWSSWDWQQQECLKFYGKVDRELLA